METGVVNSNDTVIGGCVSISNTATPPSQDSRNSSSDYTTSCVMNMRGSDPGDLNEWFCDKLDLSNDTKPALQDALDSLLPIAQHLQADVFNGELPVISVVLFIISNVMLAVGLAGTSKKRRYKAAMLITILLSTCTLALALVTSIGSRQASNALFGGNFFTSEQALGGDVFVEREALQYIIQDAYVTVAAAWYIIVGIRFVRRNLDGGEGQRNPFGSMKVFNFY